MTSIIIEFASPNAKEKARSWRKEIVEVIEEAILNLMVKVPENKPQPKDFKRIPLFKTEDFSVYMTFKPKETEK